MTRPTVAAAVAIAPRRTELRELALAPTPSTGGLLKVEATGVCGSDWPYYTNLPSMLGPLILGHEMVGVVAEAGPDAAARWGVRDGDRVALEEYLPCGHCEYCLSGDFRLCEVTEVRRGGLRYGSTALERSPGLWGGYAQYLALHPSTVFHKLPASLPAREATLALPVGNGIEWVHRQGGAGPGQVVLIQGPGQQGLACVLAAREAGAACVIVTGLGEDAQRLAVARTLGANHTIDVQQEDVLARVSDLTGGAMADLVIDCASGGAETVNTALRLARKRGRVLLAAAKGRKLPEFDSDLMIARYLTVRGMRGHSYAAVEQAIALLASGRYPIAAMTTHLLGLADVDLALRTIGGEGLAGAIHMSVDPWQ